jgi:hypothetical protein
MPLSRSDLLGQINSTTGSNQGTANFVSSSFSTLNSSFMVIGVMATENSASAPSATDMTVTSSTGVTVTPLIRQTVTSSFATYVGIFTAPVITGASGTLTVSFNGRNMSVVGVAVAAYTGYDTSTPTGVTGTNSQSSGFTTPNPASLTLSGAPAATSEVWAIVSADKNTANITPGTSTGWAEITDLFNPASGVNGGYETEFKNTSTSPTVTWDDIRPGGGALFNWVAAAVEIRAASGAAIVDMSAALTGTGSLSAALTRQVNLAAGLTATGTLSVGLTREQLLAAGLTATGSLMAGLTRQVNTGAALTATGSLGAALTREVGLTSGLTATGSMSATLSAGAQTVTLSANFTATAGMTAVFSLPTIGPTDLIGTPVAEELMTCFMEQLSTLPTPPRYVQLRVGQETSPLIGPNIDECCAGLAWIRVANIYPSWDSFPAEDNTWLPCGPLAYAVVLEMGVSFCMPWSDSGDTLDNIDPPSTADWQSGFTTQMQHQTLMRRAAACCWRPTQRRAVGEWTPLSVEGGCTGGKLLVTVSVMAPCGDC